VFVPLTANLDRANLAGTALINSVPRMAASREQ
jgi:hypothetical protein